MTDAGQSRFIFRAQCPDRTGIVHALTGAFVSQGANVDECQQFGDARTGEFFIRVQLHGPASEQALRASIEPVAAEYGMTWKLRPADRKVRTLILVSRFGHCLHDLLYRQSADTLPIDIVGVASNHQTFAALAGSYGLPFHHIPVTAATKAQAEDRLLQLIDDSGAELVVLARYMQVLSDDLTRKLPGRVINIHHSFLPSFKGARPYHQAHDRGVKIIGATAHYVTADLDEGPIIEQDTARIDHTYSADELVIAGRDVEAQVLARAIRWHAQERVFLNGSSTVVLR